MLSGGLQATRIKIRGSLLFFPYLSFTSFHHTFLLWRPRKPGWVKRGYFLFSQRPLGVGMGGRGDFCLFLTLILYLLVLHGRFMNRVFPVCVRFWKASAVAAVSVSEVFACVCDSDVHLQAVWLWLGVQVSRSGMKCICGKPAGPQGIKPLTLVSFTFCHEQLN